jgi:hypothetical protein
MRQPSWCSEQVDGTEFGAESAADECEGIEFEAPVERAREEGRCVGRNVEPVEATGEDVVGAEGVDYVADSRGCGGRRRSDGVVSSRAYRRPGQGSGSVLGLDRQDWQHLLGWSLLGGCSFWVVSRVWLDLANRTARELHTFVGLNARKVWIVCPQKSQWLPTSWANQ